MKAHAETLWACDFFSQKVVTATGLVPVFMLVFINILTRRVWASLLVHHAMKVINDPVPEKRIVDVDAKLLEDGRKLLRNEMVGLQIADRGVGPPA